MTTRVGFLGAGLIATFHSKMLRASGVDATWAGVWDPDPERRESFARASGATPATSEAEVLDGCDAVYVCTWTSEHPRLVDAAVERGLPVFCEKPLGVDLATATAMTARVVGAGTTHQVGLILRSSPAYTLVRQLVASEELGRPMTVVFRDDQFLPVRGHYGSSWRGDVDKAGAGTLLEHSIHDVDLLEWILGPVSSVGARSREVHGIAGIEDVLVASAAFESGVVATLTSVWHDVLSRGSSRRLEVFFERGLVVVEGHDWFGPVSVLRGDADATPEVLADDALVAEVERRGAELSNPDGRFVTAAAAHEPSWPDFTVALRAHVVTDAMYRSAATSGAPIDVPAGIPDLA
ncbi:MAG TPA: Gfo/Idh/MocA family oxidoreductase [Acidimicrobiales bacterium]|nr:Gfo/Idh/MocA family oxidoreductase [Acidimicrobiales bacterium]